MQPPSRRGRGDRTRRKYIEWISHPVSALSAARRLHFLRLTLAESLPKLRCTIEGVAHALQGDLNRSLRPEIAKARQLFCQRRAMPIGHGFFIGAAMVTQLNNEQVNRYKRHLILPEVGTEGQLKLLNASVLCVGAGGLGCPISLYLAAAGVGTIGLADIDVVSPSNLQRQILFGVSDVGVDKVKAAAKRLKDVNPDVKVIEHKTIVNSSNVLDLVAQYDVIIDGTDNFPTRYCVNDACVMLKKPNVYGSIFRFEGMVTVFAPHLPNPLRAGERGPCYRCMYPEPPDPGSVPSCAEGGVLGVLPGIVGTLQANEVLKLLLGAGTPAIGKLTTFDAMDFEFKTFKVRRDLACPVCGESP